MKTVFALVCLVAVASAQVFYTGNFRGNDDLARAMDKAQVALVNDGTWDNTIGVESLATLPFYCGYDSSAYDYPERINIREKGTLWNILATGEIHLGYVDGLFEVNNDQTTDPIVAFDSSTNPPTGIWVNWVNAVLNEVENNYAADAFFPFFTNLDIVWTLYSGSTELLDALNNGDIDVAAFPFNTAAYYRDAPRHQEFTFTCPLRSRPAGALARLTSSAGTLESTYTGVFQDIANNVDVDIVVQGTGSCANYQTIYNGADVTCLNDADAIQAGLLDGTYDYASENYDALTMTSLSGNIPGVALSTFILRQDYSPAALMVASPLLALAAAFFALF
mmetsp:Transcript_21173/g.59593  ORF Transcript_21173/g.59593 Transcript_21173/m.59593 type:complete len:335 (-) Transcript_21173:61-1065(-)|eukprot:CAMPEP_0119118338 /NCGR_PEP_ID=MMETSP1310-20130426/229_1 /TAXON_ID=464262 /ORGANISM="Genus nov. species nov., Strain RCC2339" /LENGTH=334 /DNA_ID=CAMNT_0007107689 /DNA_START=29 /DNA_END=1033 /DNA_ORIENTATION=-